MRPFPSLGRFLEKYPAVYGFIQDIAFALIFVFTIALILYIFAGIWPPMVSVNGLSMHPNMEDGDLVFIQGLDRGDVKTSEASANTGYRMYSEPGDVIVYTPHGDASIPLVIHRAIRWVNESEPMWPGGPLAPASGYITLGDNNDGMYDQDSRICPGEPVRKEWIIGIARFKLPYLGHLRSLV